MSKETEIKELVGAFNETLSDFKQSNNERLEKIEKSQGHAELESKVNKQVDSLLSIEKQVSELKTLSNELKSNTTDKSNAWESKEYIQSANDYYKSFNIANVVEKAFQQRIDNDGGVLVIPEIEAGIYQRAYETSPIRNLAAVKTISGNEYHKTVRKEQISSGGWVSELENVSTTNTGEYGVVKISVHKHMARPEISDEMFEDSAFNMEQEILTEASDVLAREQNTAFITGNGVGKPKGITKYDAWSGSSYEFGKLEQVKSGSAADVTVDGLISLQNALKEEYQSSAVFMMARATFAAVIKLKGTDRYFFSPGLDRNVGEAFNLLGRPVIFAADMPSLGAGNLAIAYGDFGRGYTVVDKAGTKIVKDPYTSVSSIRYNVSKRVGGGVCDFDAIKLQKIEA